VDSALSRRTLIRMTSSQERVRMTTKIASLLRKGIATGTTFFPNKKRGRSILYFTNVRGMDQSWVPNSRGELREPTRHCSRSREPRYVTCCTRKDIRTQVDRRQYLEEEDAGLRRTRGSLSEPGRLGGALVICFLGGRKGGWYLIEQLDETTGISKALY